IIHRDLKPANVLLVPLNTGLVQNPLLENGTATPAAAPEVGFSLAAYEPKITDFGLAKRLDSDVGHTATGQIMGTASYMAPEQPQGGRVGQATDVYALGATFYDLLTGRPPFQGTTMLDTLVKVRTQDPVPPTQLQPDLPRDIETICLKCLEKEAGKRYVNAQELADDLRRFLNGEPILARPASVWERGVKWARRRPAAAALIGVAATSLVSLIGGLTAYGAQTRRHNEDLQQEVKRANAAEQQAGHEKHLALAAQKQ